MPKKKHPSGCFFLPLLENTPRVKIPTGFNTHTEKTAMNNPRTANGSLRRKHRARFKAMQLPCAICGKPIAWDEPSDAKHPNSFCIDEIKPVSRWREWGYESAKACANDWNNLQCVHWRCNQIKSNKVPEDRARGVKFMMNLPDGEW